MAILAVNAGSSSLKFSLHPLLDGQVQPHVLSGSIQGLEPGGSPDMGWQYRGAKQQRALSVPAGASPFAVALDHLRSLTQDLDGDYAIAAVAHRAAQDGASIATTMGFSALDGLMMGTRSGSLDAGVLLYLLEQGWTHAQIEKLLYKQSGLLGVSGISADMRRLRQKADQGSADARRAIAQFTHRVVRETGALTACLGGLDLLAFSGGIGENDVLLRQQACERLAWTGLRIDAQRNREADGKQAWAVHAPDSRIEIWVIPTDEGRVAAREAAALLESAQALQQAGAI